jgi:hypothetical protein
MKSEKLRTTRSAETRIAANRLHFHLSATSRPCRARGWAETGPTHKKRLSRVAPGPIGSRWKSLVARKELLVPRLPYV